MTWKRGITVVSITFMVLTFLGCNSSGGGGNSGGTKVETSMDLSLAALYTGKSSKITTGKELNAATTILLGELQAENHTTGTTETFTWSAYLDEADLNMTSNKTIALAPGDYTFTMVLSNDDYQYAGEAFYEIVDGGQHTIPLTIKPIIGDTNIDVSVVGELAGYKFKYATSELTDITAPQLGVVVDGGAEQMFTINPDTGLTDAYLNLTNGSHTIHLNLYDANVQIGRSVPEQESVTIVAGEPFSIDLIALHGEAEFVFSVEDGNATVTANVPAEVIEEIGLDKLQVVLLLSDNNSTTHEEVMTLTTENNATTASVILEGLQYGTYAMQLKFNNTDDTQVPVASCLIDSVILDKTGSTVDCTLTLQKRAIIGGNLLATVGVNVFNTSYEPIAGAKVYANDTLIGLTGSGSFGTKGYLKMYHTAGDVTLKAEDINMTGSKNVTLEPLSVNNHDIILDSPLYDINGSYGKPWKYAPVAPGDADTWENTGKQLPASIAYGQLAVINDTIYLFGGYKTASSYKNTIYKASIDDPTNWSDTQAQLPSNFAYSQLLLIEDKLYLFGGYTATGAESRKIYTASVNTPEKWEDTNVSLPDAIGISQAVVIGDYIYLFGGHVNSNSSQNNIYKAPLSEPTKWVDTNKTLPSNLSHSQVVVNGQDIYLFGGRKSTDNYTGVIYKATISDPTTWLDTNATLPENLISSQVAVIGENIYLFGGSTSFGNITNGIYKAPASEPTNWSKISNTLPNVLANSHIAVIGNYVYLFGGSNASNSTNVIYRSYIGQ